MVRKTTQKIDAKIPVILFKEGSKIVVYSPAIDISTYGNTEEQARKRFIEAASIFFAELIKMGTLDDVLAECGWRKVAPQDTWYPVSEIYCINPFSTGGAGLRACKPLHRHGSTGSS